MECKIKIPHCAPARSLARPAEFRPLLDVKLVVSRRFLPSFAPLTETNERRKSLTHCEHQRGCKNAARCVACSVQDVGRRRRRSIVHRDISPKAQSAPESREGRREGRNGRTERRTDWLQNELQSSPLTASPSLSLVSLQQKYIISLLHPPQHDIPPPTLTD